MMWDIMFWIVMFIGVLGWIAHFHPMNRWALHSNELFLPINTKCISDILYIGVLQCRKIRMGEGRWRHLPISIPIAVQVNSTPFNWCFFVPIYLLLWWVSPLPKENTMLNQITQWLLFHSMEILIFILLYLFWKVWWENT